MPLQAVTKELLCPDRGLFISKDGGRSLHPNAHSATAAGADHLSHFALLGRIAGLVAHWAAFAALLSPPLRAFFTQWARRCQNMFGQDDTSPRLATPALTVLRVSDTVSGFQVVEPCGIDSCWQRTTKTTDRSRRPLPCCMQAMRHQEPLDVHLTSAFIKSVFGLDPTRTHKGVSYLAVFPSHL